MVGKNKVKDPTNPMPKAIDMIRMYFTVLFVVLMLFGILLLPSTHIPAEEIGLVEKVTADNPSSSFTPFVNNEFIFYWSPIDPLYDQADNEQNCPWGIENGYDDDHDGNTDDEWNDHGNSDSEPLPGINFYGDSFISDEGAVSIGSYNNYNNITVTLLNGHLFTQQFKDDYYKTKDPNVPYDEKPGNTIRSWTGEVYCADKNNNGRPDREDYDVKRDKWNISLDDPARAPLNSPDLHKVQDHQLWQGELDKHEGKIFFTTRDWWIWDGTIKVESTGRVTVQKMTMTNGFIDKNNNGVADLWDDCDRNNRNDPNSYNNGDDETSHGVNTAWFANGMSDDAIWSFYGDEFFGFVHRDLMIASYDDDNHITIVDKTDGDDTFEGSNEIILDDWENFMHVATFVEDTWCAGDDAGDNNELDANYRYFDDVDWDNREEAVAAMTSNYVQRSIDSGNFEADWVYVKADKPVTIYGGIWDNNFHTQAYGFLGSRYYVPLSTAVTITGLEREAHIEIDFDDSTENDDEITIEPGEEFTLKSMSPRAFSNNYVAEVEWVRIISDWPIRVEVWMANDDNAFDETQISTFIEGFDYYPAMETWDLAIHHHAIVYIVALEDDTEVGWKGTWLDDNPSDANLDKYEIYRIVVDSNEDYDGDGNDDTEPDNQDELESVMQLMQINADKEVLLQIRYARDYSCEPQDIDIVLSINPTVQKSTTGEPFWSLPLILSILLAVDIVIVTVGGKGIVGSLSFTGKNKFFKKMSK